MYIDDFYRFELVRDGWQVMDQFNFILPPQEVSFDSSYRGALIKTSGGTHVDVYRMDNMPLRLAGTTGGAKIRTGWGKRLRSGNGLEALTYFRDNIHRYVDHRRYSEFRDRLAIRFWDIEFQEYYWVYINKFTFRKTRERPIGGWFDFTVDMTTIDPPENLLEKKRFFRVLKGYRDTIRGAIDDIQSLVDDLDAGLQLVNAYIDAGLGFVDSSLELMTAMSDDLGLVVSFLDSTTGDVFDRVRRSLSPLQQFAESMGDLADETRFLYDGEYAESCEKRWVDLTTTVSRTVLDFQQLSQTNQRVQGAATSATGLEPIEEDHYTLEDESETQDTEKFAQLPGVYPSEDGTVTDEGSSIGNRGDREGQRPSHYVRVTVVEGETLSDIAERYYADAQMVSTIVEFNELESSELEAGQILQIPRFHEAAPLYGNLVLDRTGDQYGQDLMLDHQGFFLATGTGDLATTRGIQTLVRAAENKIAFTTGDLKSDRNFGFPSEATVGTPGLGDARALIGVRVKALMESDPRIQEYWVLRLRLQADVIDIEGKIITADGIEQDSTLHLR